MDCSQPLYYSTHAREKASEASAKHEGVGAGAGGGGASEANQTKNIYSFSYLSLSPRPTPLSLSFCAGVRFSRDSIRPFNDRIKIGENRGL